MPSSVATPLHNDTQRNDSPTKKNNNDYYARFEPGIDRQYGLIVLVDDEMRDGVVICERNRLRLDAVDVAERFKVRLKLLRQRPSKTRTHRMQQNADLDEIRRVGELHHRHVAPRRDFRFALVTRVRLVEQDRRDDADAVAEHETHVVARHRAEVVVAARIARLDLDRRRPVCVLASKDRVGSGRQKKSEN